jgi:pyridoxamine 5'-phosphate oxidase
MAQQYTRNPPLDESDVLADPLAQFERWLAEAQRGDIHEPTAMSLATVGADGRPSLRIVLFKGLDGGGFTFYTNYESRKGEALAAHPYAALTFWWDRQERQVRIEGRVERVSRELSDRYFHQRPRGSQLAAYTSRQSRAVASRGDFDARLAAVSAEFQGQDVPCPDYWGGYRVVPECIEFWQGRDNRVHDRLLYRRVAYDWRIERLEP